MTFGLKISEAASLALHTMVLLETDPDRSFSNVEIADDLQVSKNHLSKVLQRLTKTGLVKSIRGPKGGYKLAKSGKDITLLNVYEAIDGEVQTRKCLSDSPICDGKSCIFQDRLEKLNRELKDYLVNTHLNDVTNIYRRKENDG